MGTKKIKKHHKNIQKQANKSAIVNHNKALDETNQGLSGSSGDKGKNGVPSKTSDSPLIISDIKLTIGMLVSNRIQYIKNCMEALKPLLEAVPSELIVVDTKGAESDGSIDIVREYTDKIYPFTWCNDFSAARNVCFEHARGEWFLYVDDDEWFDDVTEFIEFFNSDECDKYNAGFYYTRDYGEDGTYSHGIAGRMIRRRENTCFEGKVHETFNEVFAPIKQFQVFTHHYGYAFQTEEAAKKHQDRNVSILKKELVQYGATPRLCAQMVQELVYLPSTANAGYAFAMDALKRFEASGERYLKDACAQWVMLATVRYFSKKIDLDGAKKQLAWLEKKYEMNKITWLCLAGTMANLASASWALEDMLKYARMYVKFYDWKMEQNESDIVDLINLDMPKFYDEYYYHRMLQVGAAACNRLEQYGEAMKFWGRMPFGEEGFDAAQFRKEYEMTLEGLKTVRKNEKEKISGEAGITRMAAVVVKEKNTTSQLIKSDIKLTVGMLVSNNIQYIRNAMEALKPLLEAVPSELIVVDTKGTESDGSIDIVREYTDKIYPFTWCNDFSAARNVCIEHARGEWFLYVDDDEWFDDVQEFIDFFNSKECDNYYSGYYYTKDYLPDGTYSMGAAGRIIRRTTTTRFIGRVHEAFNEVYSPAKQFSCFTHHYGYAHENEAAAAAKQKRNVDILTEEIRDDGLTPQRAAQMVQELLCRDETAAEGYRLSLEYIDELTKQGELQNSCSQWLLTASVRYFTNLKEYENMLKQAERIEKYPLTESAWMVLAATVLFSAVEEDDYERVQKYADIYLDNWDWRQSHPEAAMLQTQLDFPRFYTDAYYQRIVHMAAATANYLGNFDQAHQYWKRMPWKQESFDGKHYERDLNITIRGMQAAKDKQYDEKVANLVPLVNILAEASNQVKLNFASGNIDIAKQYLIGMQEAAISLGTTLDGLIGEGSTTVTLLEQYCELLWNCNNAVSQEEGVALADVLCEACGLITESFQKETYRPRTILLFPKRGAEWPLFEPYWTAAKQNGDKVFVIPVPCYEKHHDGSKGEVIYGEEKYPEEVAVTSYEKYNYSGKLADLIVVKDDYNAEQTFYTVHPFFYIDNIKQYAKETEVVETWDGGVKELERQMEKLKEMLANT